VALSGSAQITVNATNVAAIAAWSYGIAAIGYFAFAVRMILGWGGGIRASLLLASMLATLLWAAASTAFAVRLFPEAWLAANVFDALRYGLWFVFLDALLQARRQQNGLLGAKRLIPRWAIALAIIGLVASLVISDGSPLAQVLAADSGRFEFGLRLGLSIFALTLVEQLIRWTHPEGRWSIKPLCVALIGIFGFDLFLNADAMLFGRIDVDMWVARGVANALVIPFIAVATARNTGWTVEMHLSREAVFHSTALVVSGAFLLTIAAAGYYVRYVGGDWGRAFQIELLFGALLLIILVASSGRFRSKLRVFVSKHFFSYRYDYREEWLRFTRTLSTESALQGVHERAIMAVANLVESPAGILWLEKDGRGFMSAARWNLPQVNAIEPLDGSLPRFLERTGWVVDVKEFALARERYPDLTLPAWLSSVPNAWLIVPLISGSNLLGFVVLDTPRTAVDVNWEVRDMLKTASRQAASYLGQIHATEALLEARKFEAFNRMSAFVVHDLKNLVAQLSLMLRNAERHRTNPEFQRDMLFTVENVVERMHKLMLQLHTGTTPLENPRPVDLGPVVQRICAAKSSNERTIEVAVSSGIVTFAHEDRLEYVIGHLLQNAIDATVGGGSISVRLYRDAGFAVVEVADTGVGMSPDFLRERLFKPFETTKPAGMGIGVYESMQYVNGLGGQLLIDSTLSKGTRVRVLLPIADSAAAAATPMREVA